MTTAPAGAEPESRYRLRRLAELLERVLDGVLAAMLLIMTVAICYQVFGRYVLDRSPSWSEELARYLMVWVSLIGTAAVLRSSGHITVTVLTDRLPRAWLQAVLVLRDVAVLGVVFVLAWYGVLFAQLNHGQESAAFEMPMSLPYAAIPVGAVLTGVALVLSRLTRSPYGGEAGDII